MTTPQPETTSTDATTESDATPMCLFQAFDKPADSDDPATFALHIQEEMEIISTRGMLKLAAR